MAVLIEICVDSAACLSAAVSGGADRIELCSALALGGLTPSAGFMDQAAGCGVPVMAMIRPRAGGFHWSEAELQQMETDIATARGLGLAGVVIGALDPGGRLDAPALTRLLQAADGLDCTLHRCFDLVPDPAAALEVACALGIPRVLTSGGAATAPEGAARIGALLAQAAGRIRIMPGAGVTAQTAPGLVALGARELHASCSVGLPQPGRIVDLGFAPATGRQTDAALVRALRAAVH